ncbi:MAG: hypothetical protein AB8C84_13205 [Oligoflexales bacterium]
MNSYIFKNMLFGLYQIVQHRHGSFDLEMLCHSDNEWKQFKENLLSSLEKKYLEMMQAVLNQCGFFDDM